MGISYVQPMVSNVSPTLAEDRYLKPLLSGGIYLLGDRFLHYDNRGLLIPFFMQVGSSVSGSYLAGPVEKWM